MVAGGRGVGPVLGPNDYRKPYPPWVSWLIRFTPSILVVSIFLPYIGMTYINGRHVLTYGLLVILTALQLIGTRVFKWEGSPITTQLCIGWCILVLAICCGSVYSYFILNRAPPPLVSFLASIEQYLQPVCVTIIISGTLGTLSSKERERAVFRAMGTLIWGLSLNVVAVLACVAFDQMMAFQPWLPPSFQEDLHGQEGVWLRALSHGRYSGIFNQPFEQGLAHSVGLFAWGSLQAHRGRTSMQDAGKLALLVLGGLLCISKMFIFGGLSLFVVFTLLYRPFRSAILTWPVFAAVVVMVQAVPLLGTFWEGFLAFQSLIQTDQGDLLLAWTAGRYSTEGVSGTEHYSEIWSEIWAQSPLIGFGFSPFPVLDSGPLAIAAAGGLIGLILFSGSMLAGVAKLIILAKKRHEYWVSFALLAIMIGGCLGAFSFVVNRGSTCFWVIFTGWNAILLLSPNGKLSPLPPRRVT